MTDEDRPLPPLERALRRLERSVDDATHAVRHLREAIDVCRERGTLDERAVEREISNLENRTHVSLQDIRGLTDRLLAEVPRRRRGDQPK